jgi:glutamate formiminotransferase
VRGRDHSLLAVPNISEGRDREALEAITAAFLAGGAARLLDSHHDADHHRAVLTLVGRAGSLADALAAGVAEGMRRVDISDGRGAHPHVGAVDVVPIVYPESELRGAACAEALVAAEEIGRLGVPVLIYGELAGGRSRAGLRRGGVKALAQRLHAGKLAPFGPRAPHPTAGVTLVAARAPLVAFNLELTPPATVEDARRIAALIREGGAEGLPGVRAIGVALRRATPRARAGGVLNAQAAGREGSESSQEADVVAQVSLNVERPREVPLRMVVEAVRRHARVARAELVGLAPAAALEGFPEDLPLPGFDPARQVIENALPALPPMGSTLLGR